MKFIELKSSKAKIDKAGEVLKKGENSKKSLHDALGVLSNWRAYHTLPLGNFAQVLRKRAQKVDPQAIVAQRLKRLPSILLKLSNHQTMRLSTMQDIGGLRAIMSSTEDVYELFQVYKKSSSKHSLFSFNDYIKEPKADGYRSIHLVYKVKKSPSLFLEIQLRSQLQHIWATGVEVFGTLQKTSLKSGHGNRSWLEFFSLLSSLFALKEKKTILKKHQSIKEIDLIKETQKAIRDLKVIEKLNVYTRVYKVISKHSSVGRKGHYTLILLDSKENEISWQSYSTDQLNHAITDYLDLEKKYFNEKQMDVLLANTGNMKKLEASYPNYFMDTNTLVQHLSFIMMNQFL